MDSSESHHMEATQDIPYTLIACMGPPIFMGDYTHVEVTKKGILELQHVIFENVFHVLKLSMNLHFIY